MLVFKELILFTVTTFLANSAHAGHKRVIIRVPQRTRHIYHHHVKKVPVYVLLPEKKPKVLDVLEEITKTTTSPCRESHETLAWREDKPSYRSTRSEREREKNQQQQGWTEDRDNKGAYLPADSYRTIEDDFPPPPPIDLEDLPFRRANIEDSPSLYVEPPQEQKSRQPPLMYRESASVGMVSFTYAPESMQDSYQYRISSRMDNLTMER